MQWDDKLWLIIALEDEESLKYFTKNIAGDTAVAFSHIRLIMTEALVCGFNPDGTVSFTYHGEKLNPPRLFYPAVTNTDAYLVENLLLSLGSKSIVDFQETRLLRSKILVHQRMMAAGIPEPVTNLFSSQADIGDIMHGLTFPIVVKPDNGQGGVGVHLIQNEAELKSYISEMRGDDLSLAQEFIADAHGCSYRVGTLNGKYFYGLHHQAQAGDFRSNHHVGGVVTKIVPDDEAIALAEKVASLFKLPLLGVDLFKTKDGYVVDEVNSFPGLISVDTVTKAFDALIKPIMMG
jgi:ribosomal protein S6--L-glutamate ligase